jgi:dienelactone hydrolase
MFSVAAMAACGGESGSPATTTSTSTTTTTSQPPPETPAVEQAGPYAVGNTTVTVQDSARNRTLRVEIWYPATEAARAAAEVGAPIEDFVPAGPEHDQLAALVAAAPHPGTSRTSHAARDAAPAEGGPWATVAFSHCYNGTRYATFSIAERLASHGIAVVAPDHTGGTLPDKLAGNAAPLNTDFLKTRAGDIEVVLDRVLDAGAAELPAPLRGRFDAKRVGVFGHSFGGVTAGLVLMQDARPRAGLALAVPMENPLLQGVTVSSIHVPLFFIMASEDNSIGTLGNQIIEQNYESASPPVGLVKVADAGHWSFTNQRSSSSCPLRLTPAGDGGTQRR